VLLLHSTAAFTIQDSANASKVEQVPEHQRNEKFSRVESSRRTFITRFAAAVFAAPVISSFALDGIAQAQAGPDPKGWSGDPRQQNHCNQYIHNQFLYNQCLANQPKQMQPNQPHCHSHPNQAYYGNQCAQKQLCGNQHDHYQPGADDPRWWGYGECFPFDNHHRRRGWHF
jgi:hypothetical protein